MASFNKVILIGNLTADPEFKQSTSGVSFCNFDIAVSRKNKVQGGQECDFIKVVTWRATAEFVCRYFRKGKPILVCGEIQTRSYTNSQGQKVYVTEVIANEVSFVGSQSDNSNEPRVATPTTNAYMPSAYSGNANSTKLEEIPMDDSLPF